MVDTLYKNGFWFHKQILKELKINAILTAKPLSHNKWLMLEPTRLLYYPNIRSIKIALKTTDWCKPIMANIPNNSQIRVSKQLVLQHWVFYDKVKLHNRVF